MLSLMALPETLVLFRTPEGRDKRRQLIHAYTASNQSEPMLEYHIELLRLMGMCASGIAHEVFSRLHICRQLSIPDI